MLDRMKGQNWFNPHEYGEKRLRVKPSEKETLLEEDFPKDSTKSITVPGQAITIKDLMDRYAKGRPIPVE